MIERLVGQRPGFASLKAMTEALTQALAARRLLLVIDDVWDGDHLRPFLQGGPHCRRLITTRNHYTLPADTKAVTVDTMRPDEAVALLATGLSVAASHIATFEALAARLGKWPMLLTLINGVIREQVALGMTLIEALAYVNVGLDEEGPGAFNISDTDSRNRAVARTLAVSLKTLSFDDQRRFAELAIFPEDVAIPLVTIERYWGTTAGLSTFAVSRLCAQLAARSLLLAYTPAEGKIRLHDVLRAYLIYTYKASLTRWHTMLLDAHRPSNGRWADMLDDEPYLWSFLAYHLAAAQCGEELVDTAKDLGYLTQKLFLRGALSVETDLRMAQSFAPNQTLLPILDNAIVQAGHLFAACPDLASLQNTLYVRLVHIGPLAPLVQTFEPTLQRPYVVPTNPLPDIPVPELRRTLTHERIFYSCAITNDDRLIIAGNSDGELIVWEAVTGRHVMTLTGHSGAILSCAVSADGQLLASASMDQTIRLWDLQRGCLLKELVHHKKPVRACAISADGTRVVAASDDGTLTIWDYSAGWTAPRRLVHGAPLHGCAISADGAVVVAASADGTLILWSNQTTPKRLSGHTDVVTDCVISPDGRTIISASWDKTLRVWDAQSGVVRQVLSGHTNWVLGCVLSSDSRTVVSVSRDRTVRVWNVESGRQIARLEGHTEGVSDCDMSQNGTIVSASTDTTVKIWDLDSIIRTVPARAATSRVHCCAVSADGAHVVAGLHDATLQVWDVHSGTMRLNVKGHQKPIRDCTISADNKLIITASDDYHIGVWDIHTGATSSMLVGHETWVNNCAISPDQRYIASVSSDMTLIIWDLNTGTSRRLKANNGLYGCVISPDGAIIFTAVVDGTLLAWDVTSGRKQEIAHSYARRVHACFKHRTGSLYLVVSADNILKLWDHSAKTERLSLSGHTDVVQSCAVSPDQSLIASVGWDSTLRIWDIERGICLVMTRFDGPLNECAWHPDGVKLFAAGDQGLYWLRLVR